LQQQGEARGRPKTRRPKRVRKAQAALGDTVRAFADVYLQLHAKATKRSWKTDKRTLDRDVLPFIGSFKLVDLSRANVQALLDRIDRRGTFRGGEVSVSHCFGPSPAERWEARTRLSAAPDR